MTRLLALLVLVCSAATLPLAGCGDDSSAADDGATDDEETDESGADADVDGDGDATDDADDTGSDYASACEELFTAAQALLEAEFADADGRLVVPGMVLGLDVPHCGSWRGVVGLSQLSPATPMTTDRIMNIASISKTFLAAVVLQLAAEGELSLEDTLDNWRTDVPNAATITIRQLLNHTAGVRGYTGDADCALRFTMSNAPEDLLACIMGDPADFPPGASWSYSNTGYVLLGLIVEALTGSDLHSVIRTRLLEPLGLSHTTFGNEATPAEYAHAYESRADVTGEWDLSFLWACGDMRSDAIDLLTWVRALVAGDVLGPEWRSEMQTFGPVVSPIPETYGLGLARFDLEEIWAAPLSPALGHLGGAEATSVVWYLPDLDVAAATLINHRFGRAHEAFVWQSTSRILVALGDRLRALYP